MHTTFCKNPIVQSLNVLLTCHSQSYRVYYVEKSEGFRHSKCFTVCLSLCVCYKTLDNIAFPNVLYLIFPLLCHHLGLLWLCAP